jgi:hypothetical protein
MDVMGCLWYEKPATNVSSLKLRRSQIRKVPSSPPEANMHVVNRDHDSTLTSALCAWTVKAGAAPCRVSQMRTVCSNDRSERRWFNQLQLAEDCLSLEGRELGVRQ